jgi:hypothetical protein
MERGQVEDWKEDWSVTVGCLPSSEHWRKRVCYYQVVLIN